MPTCRCGRQIVFGKSPEGKFIPLDTVAPVYQDVTPPEQLEGGTMFVARMKDAYVSHFATCPNANEFSRRNTKQEQSDQH